MSALAAHAVPEAYWRQQAAFEDRMWLRQGLWCHATPRHCQQACGRDTCPRLQACGVRHL